MNNTEKALIIGGGLAALFFGVKALKSSGALPTNLPPAGSGVSNSLTFAGESTSEITQTSQVLQNVVRSTNPEGNGVGVARLLITRTGEIA